MFEICQLFRGLITFSVEDLQHLFTQLKPKSQWSRTQTWCKFPYSIISPPVKVKIKVASYRRKQANYNFSSVWVSWTKEVVLLQLFYYFPMHLSNSFSVLHYIRMYIRVYPVCVTFSFGNDGNNHIPNNHTCVHSLGLRVLDSRRAWNKCENPSDAFSFHTMHQKLALNITRKLYTQS